MGLVHILFFFIPQLIMIAATCTLLWLLNGKYRYIAYFLTSLFLQQGIAYLWAFAMANGLIGSLDGQRLTYFVSLLSHWIAPVTLMAIVVLIVSRRKISTKSEAI